MPTKETEVPPQRVWIRHRVRWAGEWNAVKINDGDIPYVPASALAEVWDFAIWIQCQYCAEGDKPVWDSEVGYAYHHKGTVGCAASKLIEGRDAALSGKESDEGTT